MPFFVFLFFIVSVEVQRKPIGRKFILFYGNIKTFMEKIKCDVGLVIDWQECS